MNAKYSGLIKKLFSVLVIFNLLFPIIAQGQNYIVEAPESQSQSNVQYQVYNDPMNYPLKITGQLVDTLADSQGVTHSITFNSIIDYSLDVTYMDVRLIYNSSVTINKDSKITIESYKEENGTLTLKNKYYYDVANYTAVILSPELLKQDFVEQEYIYFRIGVSKISFGSNYSDETLFKMENPYYSGPKAPKQYVLVNNESNNGLQSEFAGSLQINNNEYTLESNLELDAFQMDVNMPFDEKKYKSQLLDKSSYPIKKASIVGDKKDFWVVNQVNNLDYQVNAELLYSGTKVNVWVHNNQITSQDATKLGSEFDNQIYSKIVQNFAPESDLTGDGKVNILCFDIQDGFSGSGGYVAGYFYPRDLYNIPNSNYSEIFYIDTYPTMGNSTSKDVTKAYDTLAHEFQHMVNYNQNVLVENNPSMDTWLNEAMSMAAEQIYKGQTLTNRINYYNSSSSITNGHSLLYWDNAGDTLSNYALSYLFGQYLKIQSNQGDSIFKEIITSPYSNYQSIENVVKKYIDPTMSFGQFTTKYRGALVLKEPSGMYGFKGDPAFNALQTKIYTDTPLNLRGGGAIVKQLNDGEIFTIPVDKGQDITYTLLSEPGSDTTPPDPPSINEVSDKDTQITGTSEAGATVTVTIGMSQYTSVADITGYFTVLIPKQQAGTQISISSTDLAGNQSIATVITVRDRTVPDAPIVYDVTDQSTVIRGKTEPNARILIVYDYWAITVYADSNGDFSIQLSDPILAGTKILVSATDTSGNTSEKTEVIVKDFTAPLAPIVNEVTDQSTIISGTGEVGATIVATIGSETFSGIVNEFGEFTISIPNQISGTEISLILIDRTGNRSESTIVKVKDITAPTAPNVKEVQDSAEVVSGKAEAGSIIKVKIGINEFIAEADIMGDFSVSIPKQQAGTEIFVTATDLAGNVSIATSVTVKDATPPTAPIINEITDQSTEIIGAAEPYARILIAYDSRAITIYADNNGDFRTQIDTPIKAGTKITVYAFDTVGNQSIATEIYVMDVTAPSAPIVNEVTDHSTQITGTSEANATIYVMIEPGKLLGGKADSNGNFSVTFPSWARIPGKEYSVFAEDTAGNLSVGTKLIVKDATAPSVPIVNNVTDQSLEISGSAEPNTRILIAYDSFAITIYSDSNGDFKTQIESPIKAGTKISVIAIDEAGNQSQASELIVADVTEPTAPIVKGIADNVIEISGSTEANARILIVYDYWAITIYADSNGDFKTQVESPIKAGTKVTFYAFDTAGNKSAATEVLVADMTAPTAPTVNEVSDQSSLISGTSEVGSSITVTIGSEVYTAYVDETGTYNIGIPQQKAGTSIIVNATDVAGNQSIETFITVKDVTAPEKPNVDMVEESQTTLTGVTEPNALVVARVNGDEIGSSYADADGKFYINIPGQQNGVEIFVIAVDDSGNQSEPTIITVIEKDITPPYQPIVNSIGDKDSVVSGFAEAGSEINVVVNNVEIGRGTADENGLFSIRIPIQRAGSELIFVAIDKAGNISESTRVKVVDVTAPAAPKVNNVTLQSNEVSGKAEPGALIKVEMGMSNFTTIADMNGNYKLNIQRQSLGTIVKVWAIDAVGHQSKETVITVNSI